MTDTAFVAPPDRLPPCFARGEDGSIFDEPGNASRWSMPPTFPDRANGFVSTASDLLRFARALLDNGGDILTAKSVATMTRDHLTAAQRQAPSAQAFLDGFGSGYGIQVVNRDHDPTVSLPRYGWGGGFGTLWYTWPESDTAAVLLTQVLPPSGELVSTFTIGVEQCLSATDSRPRQSVAADGP